MIDGLLLVIFIFAFFFLDKVVEGSRNERSLDNCERFRMDLKRRVEYPSARWEVFQSDGGDVNVVPVGEEHGRTAGCRCHPRVDVEGSKLVIVHNAFDHREIVEQAIAFLNGEEYRE